jgi:hypothetical protein
MAKVSRRAENGLRSDGPSLRSGASVRGIVKGMLVAGVVGRMGVNGRRIVSEVEVTGKVGPIVVRCRIAEIQLVVKAPHGTTCHQL